MLRKIIQGVLAGIMISIGGTVFLACDNRYVGAVFFSVALFVICIKGYSLYTGKIGYIPENHSKEDISVLLLGLLGNTVATIVCGYLIRYAVPTVGAAAETVCAAKLALPFGQTLVRAVFCGILVYFAVDIYKKHKNPLGILLGIPVFILSGYEHSIADMFYFSAANTVSLRAFGFIWTVILGNSLGALLVYLLESVGKGEGERSNGK